MRWRIALSVTLSGTLLFLFVGATPLCAHRRAADVLARFSGRNEVLFASSGEVDEVEQASDNSPLCG